MENFEVTKIKDEIEREKSRGNLKKVLLVSDIQGVQWKPSPHSWQGVNAKETERERGVGDLFIQWGHIKDQHVIYIHIKPSDYFIFIFRTYLFLFCRP